MKSRKIITIKQIIIWIKKNTYDTKICEIILKIKCSYESEQNIVFPFR